jgi:hypothetical protein
MIGAPLHLTPLLNIERREFDLATIDLLSLARISGEQDVSMSRTRTYSAARFPHPAAGDSPDKFQSAIW